MTKAQRVVTIWCGIEAATALGLLVAPSVVTRLVLGANVEGAAIIIGNLAGLALISLAIACWPRASATGGGQYVAMLVYNLLVALLLGKAGAAAMASGMLLWPIVIFHFVFAILVALASIGSRRGTARQARD